MWPEKKNKTSRLPYSLLKSEADASGGSKPLLNTAAFPWFSNGSTIVPLTEIYKITQHDTISVNIFQGFIANQSWFITHKKVCGREGRKNCTYYNHVNYSTLKWWFTLQISL